MNRFDATACAFVSARRTAQRLPEGGLVIKLLLADNVAVTIFYSPFEDQVVTESSRSVNGATIEEPSLQHYPIEGGIKVATAYAEDLAVQTIQAILRSDA